MPVPGSQRPAEPALPPQPLQATKQEAGKENRDASARPAATGGKPAARGLTWRGCWGCSSSEIGIYVLATMVGHIHLQALGEGNDAEYKAALQDVRRLLQESLPASAVLANVNWAKACPQASGRMAEVAILEPALRVNDCNPSGKERSSAEGWSLPPGPPSTTPPPRNTWSAWPRWRTRSSRG